MIKTFTNQSLLEITKHLEDELEQKCRVEFMVLNPDTFMGTFSGKQIILDEIEYTYRGYKAWVNLAEILKCRMMTPQIVDNHKVKITFDKLNTQSSFHTAKVTAQEEKYGVDSLFFKINKNEEPTFFMAYHKALKAVKVQNRKYILNLGINKGDEFELICSLLEESKVEALSQIEMIGVDYSASAIEFAQNRFKKYKNIHFFKHDINALEALGLKKADLIISIGTFQSPNINYKPFLMNLVQNHLQGNGAIILGFPNSRWIDGELVYGAVAPNYNYSEMSLLYNDVIFAKKYLQQKKFRVTITGREYIFLSATKIGSL